VLITGVVLATLVVHHPAQSAFSGVLRVDALSAFMVIVIGAIGLLAVCQSVRYLEARDLLRSLERAPRHALRGTRPGLHHDHAAGGGGRQRRRDVGGG
jgi:hydrogenase-4 component F